MFDSPYNVVFIIIIIAVFIGRMVVEAKRKKAPPRAAPKIPALHFEEDEEAVQPAAKTAGKTKKKHAPAAHAIYTPLFPEADAPPPSLTGAKSSPAKENVKTAAAPLGQRGFALNLNHLSPMKQAVVMAEILGPPKGMI